jgi:hypothetical protein
MVTTPRSTDADVAALRRYAREILPQLLRPAEGLLRRPYLSAGVGSTYPDLVDWDAVWAGAAYLRDGDPEPLRSSLLNLIEHVLPDGKGQRRIGARGYSAPGFQLRPFLATGCFVLSRETEDVGWLGHDGLERVARSLLYRHERHTGRAGLVRWLHVDEGFADNGPANWAWEPDTVEATDLNAQLVVEHAAVAWLADRLGDAARTRRHRDLAQLLAERIEAFLWDDERGFYFSRYNPADRYRAAEPIRCLHYTNLWPLWAGLASAERARRVIERHVLSEEAFWGPFGLRSMARSEPYFNNARRGLTQPMHPSGHVVATSDCSNWQGPVWAPVNCLVATALARYGYAAEAAELAARTVSLFADGLRRHGCFHENYHSETGEPLAAPGIGSWCLMVSYLPADVAEPPGWWLRELELP